jgi:hypothetical protein
MHDYLLCAVDDSCGARDATRCANAIAGRLEGRLVLVHVASLPAVAELRCVRHGRQELRDCASCSLGSDRLPHGMTR